MLALVAPGRFESDGAAQVDAATWKVVALTLDRGERGAIHVQLLRPPEWLEHHRAECGAKVFLDLRELGARGWATVETVAACPELAEGEGKLVTGTYRNSLGKPADLKLQGIDQAIGVTLHHLIWSEGDGMWIPVGRLESGDKVRVLGEVVTVASVEPRDEAEAVYNIEVDGDHVYRVADAGVLVHNTSCDLIRVVGPNQLAKPVGPFPASVQPGTAFVFGGSKPPSTAFLANQAEGLRAGSIVGVDVKFSYGALTSGNARGDFDILSTGAVLQAKEKGTKGILSQVEKSVYVVGGRAPVIVWAPQLTATGASSIARAGAIPTRSSQEALKILLDTANPSGELAPDFAMRLALYIGGAR